MAVGVKGTELIYEIRGGRFNVTCGLIVNDGWTCERKPRGCSCFILECSRQMQVAFIEMAEIEEESILGLREKMAKCRCDVWSHVSQSGSSVAQSCPTLCDPMNRSTPGLPVHHQLPEFTQTHVHQVSDAIQPSHPPSPPSPPAPNPSQHQSLFQWVNSLHEVAKVLEFQL